MYRLDVWVSTYSNNPRVSLNETETMYSLMRRLDM